MNDVREMLDLLDWKRRVFALYGRIRSSDDPRNAWELWRDTRNEMFQSHPQSPIPQNQRPGFQGLELYPYDPSFRVSAEVQLAEPEEYDVPTSGDETFSFKRMGRANFELGGSVVGLELYWLTSYGGGLFVPFRDETSRTETYGAGRYLIDTVKGADLGMDGNRLVLDFNFAYSPSCSYDPKWVCPLSPPPNRLAVSVTTGEKHAR